MAKLGAGQPPVSKHHHPQTHLPLPLLLLMLPLLLPLPLLHHVQAEQDTRMAAVGKSKLNFNLTPEMIAQIFAERPHVKTAFLNVGPGVWVGEVWKVCGMCESIAGMRSELLDE